MKTLDKEEVQQVGGGVGSLAGALLDAAVRAAKEAWDNFTSPKA